MPPPKKKSKKNLHKGFVIANETSPTVTRNASFNDSNNETGQIMEPSEEFTRSTTAVSTSKASPSGSKRPFMQRSIAHSACIPINDDRHEVTEEREEAYDSRDNSSTKVEGECQGMTMTLDEMQEHVSHCLTLNTENKINSKNAFALKLIDCMAVISKNLVDNNFSAMACQLDAGAKIYSRRVDAVHHQAMKLVESCIFAETRANNRRSELEVQEHFSNADDDESPGGKLKDARRKGKKNVIAASSDQISRKLKESDPREEFVRCEALPGGIFDKVRYDPEDLSLSLLKHTPFWIDWKSYKPVKAEGISRIRTIVIKNQRLGPLLGIEQDVEVTTIPKQEAYILHDSSYGEKTVGLEDNPLADIMKDEVETESNNEAGYESEIISVAASRMKEGGNEVSRLDAMKTVFHSPGESDYHYLKMDNSYFWAGPDYWKRPHGLSLSAASNLKKVTIKKKNEPVPIEYTGSTRIIISLHPKQRSSRVASKHITTSGENLVAKWTMKKVTLPQDIHFEPQTLLMLFHAETSSDSILNGSRVDVKCDELDFGNEHDAAVVKHLEVTTIEDTDGSTAAHNKHEPQNVEEYCESSQQKSDTEESKEGDSKEEGSVGRCASGPCDMFEEENLVPMVKTVKYEPIKYTVKPIRVDMRHLKQVLLAIVLGAIEDKEKEMLSAGVEDPPPGSVQFRKIVVQLFNCEELHHRTREDLTPAMSFLALLSIASEHALHLVNDETGDVIISIRRFDKASVPPTTTT